MPGASAAAHFQMGIYYMMAGEHRCATPYFENCLKLFRELGLPHWIAISADRAGHNARERGDFRTAMIFTQEAMQILRDSNRIAAPFLLSTMAEI